MIATSMLLVASLVGVDTGWHTLADGRLEYIIQIEPELFDSLRAGGELTSEIPAHLQSVRRYRIVVGTEPPPRDPLQGDEPPGAATADPIDVNAVPKEAESGAPPAMPDRYEVPPSLEPHAAEPFPLNPDPVASRVSTFKQTSAVAPAASSGPEEAATPTPDRSTKPWLPLTLAVAGLIGSLAANVYLGWIWLATRRRFHALASQFKPAT